MQLTYRGTAYDSDRSQTTTHHPIQSTPKLIYRGYAYKLDSTTIQKYSNELETHQLKYRGNPYKVSQNKQINEQQLLCYSDLEATNKDLKHGYFQGSVI